MGIKLVIAEKPSLAKAIRIAMGSEYVVVNAIGHLYEQAKPDDYLPNDVPKSKSGKKIWRAEDLPIIPKKWIMKEKGDRAKEITNIKKFISDASVVINAGDPDREGQLLIDEILVELKYKGPVKRVWIKSVLPEGIQKAFKEMKDNSEYKTLSDSAMGRSHADWLVGLNLTRAWTISSGDLVSVGRVQTPTLALIVKRDLEIDNFKQKDFFDLPAKIQHHNGAFSANWRPEKTDIPGFDEEGRLIDREIAKSIAAKSGEGRIVAYSSVPKYRSSPLPFSLSALQKKADAMLGIGAQETLDIVQKLYDEGFTSYPRTNCQYLGQDQHKVLAEVARNLSDEYKVKTVDIKHPAFNDKEVTAHTAIVPTGKSAASLSGREEKVYNLIAKSVIAMFMPKEEFMAANATVEMGGEKWNASGKTVTKAGWTQLFDAAESDVEDDDKKSVLPVMSVGDVIKGAIEIKSMKTSPPKRFTEGSLIDAMNNIHRYIDDPVAKSKLKETLGIGEESTRGVIIEKLFKNELLEKKGRNVLSTQSGKTVIAALPGPLTDPVTTAIWEDKLSNIAEGKLTLESFEKEIVSFVQDQLVIASKSSLKNHSAKHVQSGSQTSGNTVYLNVPFVDKDAAKKLGARWDGETKKWYTNEDPKKFKQWLANK